MWSLKLSHWVKEVTLLCSWLAAQQSMTLEGTASSRLTRKSSTFVCVFAGQKRVCGGECVKTPAVWERWRPGGGVFLGRDGGPRGRRGRRPLRSSVGVRRWSHTFTHRGDTRAAHTNGPEEWVRNKYSRKYKVCWLTKENIFFIPV